MRHLGAPGYLNRGEEVSISWDDPGIHGMYREVHVHPI